MNRDTPIPPLRELPQGRLTERKEHLVAEIRREPKPRHARPSLPIARRPVAVLAGGVATVALVAAVALLATRAGTETASAAEVQAKIGIQYPAPDWSVQ